MSQSLTKRIKSRIGFVLIPFVAHIVIRIIYATCKKHIHLPKDYTETASVFVFWHGDLLMQNFLMRHLKLKRPISIIASAHKDGALIAKAMTYFGIQTIAGSSSKGGAKALINAMAELKAGNHVMITPDGPRGPRHSVAKGAVVMSQKVGVPIVAHQCVPQKYWRINSWDQFIIPKPFTTLEFFITGRIDIKDKPLQEAQDTLQKALLTHAV